MDSKKIYDKIKNINFDLNQIDYVMMACMENPRPERLTQFYKKIGYSPVQTQFYKKIK
jgi:hypothetical protein